MVKKESTISNSVANREKYFDEFGRPLSSEAEKALEIARNQILEEAGRQVVPASLDKDVKAEVLPKNLGSESLITTQSSQEGNPDELRKKILQTALDILSGNKHIAQDPNLAETVDNLLNASWGPDNSKN